MINETLDWLSRLVAFDTTSRESNLPLVEAVAEYARGLRLSPRLLPTGDIVTGSERRLRRRGAQRRTDWRCERF